jgi:hypothetical protein
MGAPRAYPINRIGDLRHGSLTKANAYHCGCILCGAPINSPQGDYGEINLSVEVEREPCDRPRNKALASWRDAGFLKAVAGSYAQVGAVPAMMEACGKAPGAAMQRREPSLDGGWTAH